MPLRLMLIAYDIDIYERRQVQERCAREVSAENIRDAAATLLPHIRRRHITKLNIVFHAAEF